MYTISYTAKNKNLDYTARTLTLKVEVEAVEETTTVPETTAPETTTKPEVTTEEQTTAALKLQ